MTSSSQPFVLVAPDHLLPPTMMASPDDHTAGYNTSNHTSSSAIGQTLTSTACFLNNNNNPSHTSSSPPPNLWGSMDQLWSAAGEEKRSSSSIADLERCCMGVSAVRMKRNGKVGGRRKKVREPRFCFKTLSEVDVLDDGYKWRKYGQKVVKNTQHPRSYYRCTQENCRVKKRVERLAEDPRMVITTYEGRHAHYPWQEREELQAPSSSDSFFW